MGSPITFGGFNNIDFGLVLNAIMQQERAPLTAVETQKTALQAQNSAFATFATKLGALETAVAALAGDDTLANVTATSSDEEAVGISTGSASIRAMQVLLAPVVSEKSTMIGEKNNQYAFRVLQDATKAEVKAAIETFFKVEVDSVNMINIAGKKKRFAKGEGRRRNVRKAYVSLKDGQEINFAETK